jgi:methanogenic corrinoid protein MtbC1
MKSFEVLCSELMAAFRAVDEERANDVLTEALNLYTLEDVCLRILQPVLVKVGDAWAKGEISVAGEHFASAFVRTRLSNILHSSQYNVQGPLALVACAPGELHELGPMFLAVFLRRAGFRVVYLGQNVPLESLQTMTEALQPDVICISAAKADAAAGLKALPKSLDEVRGKSGKVPLLAFGGQLFNADPSIAESMGGLYLGADAGEAVRRLAQQVA